MSRFARLTAFVALCALTLVPTVTLEVESAGVDGTTAHHLQRGFRNLNDGYHFDIGVQVRHVVLGSLSPQRPRGIATAVLENDGAALRANGVQPTVTWVGHSTFLVQLDGVNILTDPHWGERT